MIYEQLLKIVDSKVEIAQKELQAANESRNNETKSTAGDKHETGRAMIQLEIERLGVQLSKAVSLKEKLAQIDIQQIRNKVELGSLIITDQENYFISIGHGKLVIDNEDYYCISMASPIGELLIDQEVGSSVIFRKKELTIQEVA